MKPMMLSIIVLLILGIGYPHANPNPNPGSMAKVGTSDGNKSRTAECPTGEFAIGLNYHCGTYVHAIQLVCGKISDGKIVYSRTTNFEGASGGTGGMGKNCKIGDAYKGAITKIGARGDLYADTISYITCTPLDLSASPPKLKPKDNYSTFMYALTCTAIGGFNIDPVCPADEVLYKINIHYGLWIDSWQGYCRKPA